MVIAMEKDEVVSLAGGLRGVVIRCDVGLIWVTVAGDSSDHILFKGDEMAVVGKGKVVVMAQSWSSVRLIRAVSVISAECGNSRRFLGRSPWQEMMSR